MITVNEDRTLSFDGVPDARYRFPVWSATSRNHRVYFVDGATQMTFSDRRGHLEVFAQAAAHKAGLDS